MGRKVAFVLGIKCCLGVRQTTVCSKINVLNLLKYVLREFLNFVITERFVPLLVRALFFNETSKKSAWAKIEVTSISYKAAINIVTISSPKDR